MNRHVAAIMRLKSNPEVALDYFCKYILIMFYAVTYNLMNRKGDSDNEKKYFVFNHSGFKLHDGFQPG